MERNYDVGNRELLTVKMALEALAGRGGTFVHCVDRPHKPGVSPHRQASQLQASEMGPAVYPVQLFPLLPAGVQERQAGCPISPLLPHGYHARAQDHPSHIMPGDDTKLGYRETGPGGAVVPAEPWRV
jgi:hypothetical protein